MNTENKDQPKEEEMLLSESPKAENPIPSAEPPIRFTEDIKSLLNSLIKKSLNERLLRLEHKNTDELKNINNLKPTYNKFEQQLKSLLKNVEETKKRKEAKKKEEETPKKSKQNTLKRSLASKSVPPGKKLKISTKTEYNTNKPKEKKKLNIDTTSFKTEENLDKSSHTRAKSFKEKRDFK